MSTRAPSPARRHDASRFKDRSDAAPPTTTKHHHHPPARPSRPPPLWARAATSTTLPGATVEVSVIDASSVPVEDADVTLDYGRGSSTVEDHRRRRSHGLRRPARGGAGRRLRRGTARAGRASRRRPVSRTAPTASPSLYSPPPAGSAPRHCPSPRHARRAAPGGAIGGRIIRI